MNHSLVDKIPYLANPIFNVKNLWFGKKHCWRAPVAINFRHAPNGARR
jgi:hypothetical protein